MPAPTAAAPKPAQPTLETLEARLGLARAGLEAIEKSPAWVQFARERERLSNRGENLVRLINLRRWEIGRELGILASGSLDAPTEKITPTFLRALEELGGVSYADAQGVKWSAGRSSRYDAHPFILVARAQIKRACDADAVMIELHAERRRVEAQREKHRENPVAQAHGRALSEVQQACRLRDNDPTYVARMAAQRAERQAQAEARADQVLAARRAAAKLYQGLMTNGAVPGYAERRPVQRPGATTLLGAMPRPDAPGADWGHWGTWIVVSSGPALGGRAAPTVQLALDLDAPPTAAWTTAMEHLRGDLEETSEGLLRFVVADEPQDEE